MPDNLCDVPGVLVGHATDEDGTTGCTAVLFENPDGAIVGVDVRGSSPGTRETDRLGPIGAVRGTHALLLTGGSAFGLAAADGVVRFLEEQGIGLDVGVVRIPLVSAAVLFDVVIGDPAVRPDAEMGYRAASSATSGDFAQGSAGAGAGATVGKVLGLDRAMKGGIGSASVRLDDGLVVGALAAVNAFGEVRDPWTRKVIAGPRLEDGTLGRQPAALCYNQDQYATNYFREGEYCEEDRPVPLRRVGEGGQAPRRAPPHVHVERRGDGLRRPQGARVEPRVSRGVLQLAEGRAQGAYRRPDPEVRLREGRGPGRDLARQEGR